MPGLRVATGPAQKEKKEKGRGRGSLGETVRVGKPEVLEGSPGIRLGNVPVLTLSLRSKHARNNERMQMEKVLRCFYSDGLDG